MGSAAVPPLAPRRVRARRVSVRLRPALRPRARLLLLAIALLLGACGVEPQRAPEPIPVERLPSPAASPTDSTTARGQVWGARGGRLVPVFVELGDRSPGGRVRALLALGAPSQEPRPPTMLPRTQLVGLERSGDAVVLQFTEELRGVTVTSLPLALGQIVLTVTEHPRIRRVHVESDGSPISYVDASGRRIARAMVRGDFADLVIADASQQAS